MALFSRDRDDDDAANRGHVVLELDPETQTLVSCEVKESLARHEIKPALEAFLRAWSDATAAPRAARVQSAIDDACAQLSAIDKLLGRRKKAARTALERAANERFKAGKHVEVEVDSALAFVAVHVDEDEAGPGDFALAADAFVDAQKSALMALGRFVAGAG